MAKPKHLTRYNLDLEEHTKGRLFFDREEFCNMTDLNILHTGVDTVRQLYRGYIKTPILDAFERARILNLGGYEWITGRVGRDSGYQYKLQNADLGLILLIKNFNVKATNSGPHLKIEASPHLIDQKPPGQLQAMMDQLAELVLDDWEYNQSAVHIAVDVQGWEPPKDFVDKLSCRSNYQRQFNTIDSVDFANLAVTYNRGQSYLFGSPSGIQFAVYNKTVQAKAIDKLDFWRSVWKRQDNPFEDAPYNYDPEKPVWRLELRFHHSVVQQFAEGTTMGGEPVYFRTYAGLAPHLDGLWRYGLEAFRLMHRRGIYHPLWTIFSQDVHIQTEVQSLLEDTSYKRYYKSSSGFSGKNIELLIGNSVSLAARERMTPEELLKALKTLPFWSTVEEFYEDKGKSQEDLKDHISKLLKERYLQWGKAV